MSLMHNIWPERVNTIQVSRFFEQKSRWRNVRTFQRTSRPFNKSYVIPRANKVSNAKSNELAYARIEITSVRAERHAR